MRVKPTHARRGLDWLLEQYPAFDLVSIEWQIDPPDGRSAAHWAGPWVLVELGQPSDLVDVEPAWARWRFAIWRRTGAVHRVGLDGAVADPALYEPTEGGAE